MGIIDDFGDDYFRRHATETLDPHTFSITDADYEAFTEEVISRNVPYKSDSRRALERLRTALTKERYDDERIASAIEQIDKELGDDTKSNLATYRKEIVSAINDNIILRYAYSEGVIANSLSDDSGVREATALLRNREEYERILGRTGEK
jgi:carboxyl-terminal processing protease